ncbi:MAG TPA: redoxin domain-containing protein [Terriglobales bacterium]|nr:redoxin domain-containing protein [Terriglobales bacterium]
MSQAQIAGGSVSQQNELPTKGRRLHDFELIGALGRTVRLSDYRGRANLVVIATDERPESEKLLSDAASRYGEIKDEQAELLAVLHATRDQVVAFKQRLNLPYPVLADPDGHLHRDLGAVDSQGHDSAAVYVTDRFGEVFGIYRTAGGQPLPGITDVLDWLEFVNAQCPECEPPEWPV